ncbi:MAG: hypothetical protein J0M12_00015 [Deltaproteobacteria bacterium]|nr:hypothetical protein [Deltaproteobacteria bacterium]
MFLRSLLSLLLVAGMVDAASAESSGAAQLVNTIPDSSNKLVKLTSSGVSPQILHMSLQDSIVFFLNDTKDSLTTLEIDFGTKHMHCNGSNMRADSDGKARSARPFGPRDFAATCFHEPGTFQYKVFGLNSNPSGVTGTIVVQ